jgi:hypothetical protein
MKNLEAFKIATDYQSQYGRSFSVSVHAGAAAL